MLLDAGLAALTLCFLGNRPVERDRGARRRRSRPSPSGCRRALAGRPGVAAAAAAAGSRGRGPRASGRAQPPAGPGRAALAGAGIPRAPAPYRPHITVARIRSRVPRAAAALPATPAAAFEAATVALMRSWLEPQWGPLRAPGQFHARARHRLRPSLRAARPPGQARRGFRTGRGHSAGPANTNNCSVRGRH